MKRALLFAACVVLVGCQDLPDPHHMANERIVQETVYCEEHGLKAVVIHDWNGLVQGIECEPRHQ